MFMSSDASLHDIFPGITVGEVSPCLQCFVEK